MERHTPCSWVGGINIVKMTTIKPNLHIQCNPYQITKGIFHRTRTKNFTIHMETQKTPNSKSSLEKEELSWRNQPSWLQIILHSYSYQHSMVLAQKQKYKPMEQDRKPRNKPITLPTKVLLVKAMVFPVIMYGWESWTIKKAERRTDPFELWCWRKCLRVPWTARKSNQSILKEISTEYSLEGLLLKLKL